MREECLLPRTVPKKTGRVGRYAKMSSRDITSTMEVIDLMMHFSREIDPEFINHVHRV